MSAGETLGVPVQATPKWFEGPSDQGIYWSISDDYGLTWGPTTLIVPAADGLPQWGPVLHSQVICPV